MLGRVPVLGITDGHHIVKTPPMICIAISSEALLGRIAAANVAAKPAAATSLLLRPASARRAGAFQGSNAR